MRQQGSNLIGSARNLKPERKKESSAHQMEWNMHTHTHTHAKLDLPERAERMASI